MGAPYGNKNAAGHHRNKKFISSVRKARKSMFGMEELRGSMRKMKRPRSLKQYSIMKNKMNYLSLWK